MKTRSILNTTLLAALAAAAMSSTPALADLPARPDELTYKALEFQPPKSTDFRRVLSNGVPVYMMPSKEFPLISVSFVFRSAAHLEPEGKTGISDMTSAMIRRGGTTSVPATTLDEQFEFLAANAGSTNLNALKSNFDEAFGLFMDMLRNPGFDEAKLRVYKDETLERMKQRNDDADTILSETADRLMWGEKHFEGRYPTKAEIESITVNDLREWHKRVYQPGNVIIGVTGDFDPADMAKRLEAAMSGWEKGEKVPPPTDTDYAFKPGLYHVEKDIPQGKFIVAHRGIKRDDPDQIPLEVMNEILGGGGFTARLMKRIRSDEGLTYGVYSSFQNRVWYPGIFQVGTFSKNRTVALTARMVMQELERIRTSPVTQEEIETARNSLIETFPRTFESKAGTVNVFINDEWTGRDPNYWQNYRDRVRSVDASEVQRVAQEHLDPAKSMMLVVGKWEEISQGDPNETRENYKATMAEFYEGAPPTQLPLRDPLTLEPMKN